ncbi:hypothetical protein NIES593_13655 [Hydrococcus rivularis NIES-593]|uniref:Bacteriocin n=2 Tax=Hydrococcus TaxID=1616833 RepID=A0A1U7HF83_9CYAN|nr:hypothetical protein NIES593_13655 [Hydrococcus rivularis NIES-593]
MKILQIKEEIMSDEIAPMGGEAEELSEEELDAVAGGADIFFSSSFYEESATSIARQTTVTPEGSSSSFVFKSLHIITGAFQFIGLGLGSADDIPKIGGSDLNKKR